jgi:hypothetical protein
VIFHYASGKSGCGESVLRERQSAGWNLAATAEPPPQTGHAPPIPAELTLPPLVTESLSMDNHHRSVDLLALYTTNVVEPDI